MKKTILAVFVLSLMAGLAFAQYVPKRENIVVPYILRAPDPITLDGVLDEWYFAYPIVYNSKSVPDSTRGRAWMPEDDDDCSGVIYMMYDDEYFYFAASVRDDAPGHFSDASWAADAIEFYMGNYDIGDALWPEKEASWLNDPVTGKYEIQLNISWDASLDSICIMEYYGVGHPLNSEKTRAVYKIWDGEDGYNLEGQIYWEDLTSPSTGNKFKLTPNTRIGCTWSLYDMDETESSADFDGWSFSILPNPWAGGSPAWQCADVLEKPRGDMWDNQAAFDFVSPFIKRNYDERPVVVDGDLSEWHDYFPLTHNSFSVPENTRGKAWMPEDNDDCSGVLMMQYNDEYFYFAASVRDDAPGHFSEASWAADAIEFYMGNYDIGDAFWPEKEASWLNDPVTGKYEIQLNISWDASLDSICIREYYGVGNVLNSANTWAVYKIWDGEDGWDLEGQIYFGDLTSPSTGNTFKFTEGTRQGCAWSLYDMDETESSADFDGWSYSVLTNPWAGGSPAWQYVEPKSISIFEYLDWLSKHPTGVKADRVTVPETFALSNYPNPFNPTTTIQYKLEKPGEVDLKIYNVNGQLVKTVLDKEHRAAGSYQVKVDLSGLASGVYVAVLTQGDTKLTNKMMLLK
ncbi:MAG: T9SS type A sorting domain-containing protein [candidate division KSB1 bacterium]|nr:T9SS type A sorting domain-containing protein [candidate division KSB1 bacterium]